MIQIQRLFVSAILLACSLLAQPFPAQAGLYADHSVYEFLNRAWLYGATEQPPPTVRPESLPVLIERLRECSTNRDKLPASEQAELDELLSEIAVYGQDESLVPDRTRWDNVIPSGSPLFKHGAHLYGMRRDELSFTVDPIIAWHGIYDEDYNDEPLLRSVIGVDVQMALGTSWTAGVRFTDTAEYNQNKARGAYSPTPGYVASVSPAGASSSFDETLAYLEYHSEFVDAGFGRDRLERGPSLDRGLIVSGEAPAYLYLQLRARVKPWLVFDYFHARLDPSPVEDEVYYVSPSGKQRKVVNQKWFAAHRIEVNPKPWLQLGLSETVIYAERDPEIGYMIPLNIYWSENHHQDRDDNVAWGVDLRVQPLRGWAFYFEGLLDETSMSGLFSNKLHNRTAFALGMDVIEPLGLRGSMLQLHLTRLRPYVYSHWFAVSVYAHNGTALGSPIPPNSDALTLSFSQKFGGTWKVTAMGQRLRHGESIPGEDPVGGNIYELVPVRARDTSYPLLAGDEATAWRGEVAVEWEPLENLVLQTRAGLTRVDNETLALFLAGFTYNL